MRLHTLALATGTVCVHETSATLRTGSEAPAPLVLLHGIGSTSRSWAPQMAAWADTRPVFAWNAPGYAESSLLDHAQPGAQEYAAHLASALDALGLETVVLIASSWGCLTALALAAQQPDRVSRLVLSGPTAGAGQLPADERSHLYEQRSQRAQQLGVAAMLTQDATRLVASPSAQVLSELEAGRAGVSLPGYLAALRMLCDTDGGAMIARVRQPVLVVAGEQDVIAPPSGHALRLAALSPVTRLAMLPGCGHLPHIEQATIFRDEVHAFLSP